MLTWMAIGLLTAAAVVITRWVFGRHDSLGRQQSFPVVAVIALVVPALVAATPGILRWREERTLARAASVLVGQRVEVDCQTFGSAFVDVGSELGWVAYGPDGVPERKTLIKYEQCAALRDYLGSSKAAPPPEQIVAVHILSHESMHMAGLTNEAEAECAAMQRDAQTARLLGADPFEAQALAKTYWRTVYPRLSEAYLTGDCRPGGRLDEHLADAPWAPPTN